jgi:hypothetical protein
MPTTPLVLGSSLGHGLTVIAILHVPTFRTVYGVPHGERVKRVVGQETENHPHGVSVNVRRAREPASKNGDRITATARGECVTHFQ